MLKVKNTKKLVENDKRLISKFSNLPFTNNYTFQHSNYAFFKKRTNKRSFLVFTKKNSCNLLITKNNIRKKCIKHLKIRYFLDIFKAGNAMEAKYKKFGYKSLINNKYSYSHNFLQAILKKLVGANYVKLICINYSNVLSREEAWDQANYLLSSNKFIKKTRVALAIYQSTIALLKYKDPKPLSISLKNLFESVHYSKHKIYFSIINFILRNICAEFRETFGLLGIKVGLFGKLGVGGSVKKRKKYFILGKLTNTTKTIRRDDIKNFVKTSTGVFGFSISLYY